MKNETSFKVFFPKEHRKNSLKNIVFPWESVFTAIAKIPQGHRTAQTAHFGSICDKYQWPRTFDREGPIHTLLDNISFLKALCSLQVVTSDMHSDCCCAASWSSCEILLRCCTSAMHKQQSTSWVTNNRADKKCQVIWGISISGRVRYTQSVGYQTGSPHHSSGWETDLLDSIPKFFHGVWHLVYIILKKPKIGSLWGKIWCRMSHL